MLQNKKLLSGEYYRIDFMEIQDWFRWWLSAITGTSFDQNLCCHNELIYILKTGVIIMTITYKFHKHE